MKCAAVIAIRNEEPHLHRLLTDYISQGIDVIIIDNCSTDRSIEICNKFIGNGLLGIYSLPWNGEFNLSAQLRTKETIINELTHDWVIHADADEWLQSPLEGERLIEGIQRADQAGYNAINFEEFVFLPDMKQETLQPDYEKNLLNYYWFHHSTNRLMRAFKPADRLDFVTAAGHCLTGNVNLFPENFILRHYIVLSYAHAVYKYSSRCFAREDLIKGWHFNRLNLSSEKLILPKKYKLNRLSHWRSKKYNLNNSKKLITGNGYRSNLDDYDNIISG